MKTLENLNAWALSCFLLALISTAAGMTAWLPALVCGAVALGQCRVDAPETRLWRNLTNAGMLIAAMVANLQLIPWIIASGLIHRLTSSSVTVPKVPDMPEISLSPEFYQTAGFLLLFCGIYWLVEYLRKNRVPQVLKSYSRFRKERH